MKDSKKKSTKPKTSKDEKSRKQKTSKDEKSTKPKTSKDEKSRKPKTSKDEKSTKPKSRKDEKSPTSMFNLSEDAKQSVSKSVNKMKAEHEQISEIPYLDYEFPFENIALEGGGVKGLVYCGAMEVLEEAGIKLKRYTGSSIGAVIAALLAVGYSSSEVLDEFSVDLRQFFEDHSCGWCSLLPNICQGYGWNPGNRAEELFGNLLDRKLNMGPDVTFKELHQVTGNELCITAVNVNMIRVEYFHPKTTPNVPVKLALRMSMSIPGFFKAVELKNDHGLTDLYVDGGLLCNYPVHAYDGWWLSMKTEDCFLNRLQPLSDCDKLMNKNERFGKYNEKTIGCLVYSDAEQDVMKAKLEERVGVQTSEEDRPQNSKVYKKYREKQAKTKTSAEAFEEHEVFMASFDRFLKILQQVNSTGDEVDDTITRSELKQAFESAISADGTEEGEDFTSKFDSSDVQILFGCESDLEQIFDKLDENGDGEISYGELLQFIQNAGIDVSSKLQGYQRKEINTFAEFLEGVQDSLLTHSKYVYIEDHDIQRTIGINTDYIDTMDYTMGPEDRAFLVEQGRKATISFLKHYVHEQNPPRKSVTTQPQPSNGLKLESRFSYENKTFKEDDGVKEKNIPLNVIEGNPPESEQSSPTDTLSAEEAPQDTVRQVSTDKDEKESEAETEK